MAAVPSCYEGNMILDVTVGKNYNEDQGREKYYTCTGRDIYVVAYIYTTKAAKSTYPCG